MGIAERLLTKFQLATRVNFLGALALAGILVVGAAYVYSENKMEAAFERSKHFDEVLALAGEIQQDSLIIRRREKDYIYQKENYLFGEYKVELDALRKHLERLAQIAKEPEIEAAVDVILPSLPTHDAQFELVVKLQEEMGIRGKGGMTDEINAAADSLVNAVNETGDLALVNLVLGMRQHEKAFMLNLLPADRKAVRNLKKEFETRLATSYMPEETKTNLTMLVETYEKSLRAWGKAADDLFWAFEGLTTIFATSKLGPHFDAISATAAARQRDAVVQINDARRTMRLVITATIVLMMFLTIFFGRIISRSISRPVTGLTRVMTALARGQTDQEIPSTESGDEMGEMARAVQVFRDNAIERQRLEAAQTEEQADKQRRVEKITSLVGTFDDAFGVVMGKLNDAATGMRQTASSMNTIARSTNDQSSAVASAAEEASTNTQSVASATEELTASIREIGRRAGESANIANKAVAEAQRSNETVRSLAEAAEKIGAVVGLISDIAGQTNLLALNATIEAARAGEAGKGFAVVASEVKSLATQTAKATEDISAQISAIQGSTADAVEAIDRVTGIIGDISENATIIAAAVDEQSASTQEISSSVQQVSTGTSEVTRNISRLTAGVAESDTIAEKALAMADSLSSQADHLKTEVERFLGGVRAA